MSDVIIRVENLSKLYRLGQIGTGTLHADLKRWWHKTRGKGDPFAQVGQVNDRTKKAESEFVWALRDISFDVKRGEVLGIIGQNGAGKSTLLKVLSKITAPTSGEIQIGGRIASLLEVGTGFHPDLTGRENIFMNGAILGMRTWEIEKKFDEIVDFAGVEAYVDTPVKRYSSGMYVRLAFAVAAFLEPEILIVDEVLAVGDVEFQKKCLGRMKDVSVNDGRTVLFVSHNMAAVQSLCNRAILVENGQLAFDGGVRECTDKYLRGDSESPAHFQAIKSEKIDLLKIELRTNNSRNATYFYSGEDLDISLLLESKVNGLGFSIGFQIVDDQNQAIVYSYDQGQYFKIDNPGTKELCFRLEKLAVAPGTYSINVWIGSPGVETYLYPQNVSYLEVVQGSNIKLTDSWQKDLGLFYLEPKIISN